MKPNLLIIANRTLHAAPRVIREIEALKNDFNITAVGITAPTDNAIAFINIKTLDINLPLRIFRRLLKFIFKTAFLEVNLPLRMRKLRKLINGAGATYVIIHETEFLPSLIKIKKKQGIKIILNAHEYYPAEFEDNAVWVKKWQQYYEQVYRSCLKNVDLFINVCDSIAERCKAEFGKESLVIPNAAPMADIAPYENKDGVIRMIHHGVCMESRKIEEMIRVAEILGNGYSLDLMFLHGDEKYVQKIGELAAELPNVKIIPPVKFDEIVRFSNTYDIGIFLLAPTNFNYRVALPNKLFEFIQARLCVAISPSIEMKKIVDQFELGVVGDDFSAASLAGKIARLDKQAILKYKQHANIAAGKVNAEHYNKLMLVAILAL